MAQNGLTGIPPGVFNVPTPGQVNEAARVQGMQIRTNVANMVCHLLADRQTSPRTWQKWATMIDRYIVTGELDGDAAPPVQSRR